MAPYRLTRQAEADVREIFEYSYRAFGEYQADAYVSGLSRMFGLIADFPGIGTSSEDLWPGLRRFRFQSHYIHYTHEHGEVLIRAVLHVRRIAKRDLFE